MFGHFFVIRIVKNKYSCGVQTTHSLKSTANSALCTYIGRKKNLAKVKRIIDAGKSKG